MTVARFNKSSTLGHFYSDCDCRPKSRAGTRYVLKLLDTKHFLDPSHFWELIVEIRVMFKKSPQSFTTNNTDA